MDNGGNGILTSGGADNDEIGADTADFATHKGRDAAGKGKDKDDTGNTDGDAEASEKRAGAVFFDRIFGKAKMVA